MEWWRVCLYLTSLTLSNTSKVQIVNISAQKKRLNVFCVLLILFWVWLLHTHRAQSYSLSYYSSLCSPLWTVETFTRTSNWDYRQSCCQKSAEEWYKEVQSYLEVSWLWYLSTRQHWQQSTKGFSWWWPWCSCCVCAPISVCVTLKHMLDYAWIMGHVVF